MVDRKRLVPCFSWVMLGVALTTRRRATPRRQAMKKNNMHVGLDVHKDSIEVQQSIKRIKSLNSDITPAISRRDEPLNCGRRAHEGNAVRSLLHGVIGGAFVDMRQVRR